MSPPGAPPPNAANKPNANQMTPPHQRSAPNGLPHGPQHAMNNHASNMMAGSPMNGNGKLASVPTTPKRQAPNDSVDKPTPMKNSNGSAQKMNGGNKRSAEPMSGELHKFLFQIFVIGYGVN